MQRIFKGILVIVTFLWAFAPGLFSATLVIKGSDTLGAKLVPQMAEAFKARADVQAGNLAIEIAAEGSATGIASVIDGAADIGMLSRELAPDEIALAKARGQALETILVARDALVIIVNERNPLKSISSKDLASIFTGDIKNWAALSDEPGDLSIYTRNTSSGTYISFRKLALHVRDYSDEILKMAGNEQIAHEVANNTDAIGYVGLAYTSRPGIRILPIDGHLPGAPDYPLARPLYFLINKTDRSQPIREDFIDFSIGPDGQRLAQRINFLPAASK